MDKFYHINKQGIPTICRAKPGNCPLGDSSFHFEDKETAQLKADSINEIWAEIEDLKYLEESPFSKLYDLKTTDIIDRLNNYCALEDQVNLNNLNDIELLERCGLDLYNKTSKKQKPLSRSILTEFKLSRSEIEKFTNESPSKIIILDDLDDDEFERIKSFILTIEPRAKFNNRECKSARVVWESESRIYIWGTDNIGHDLKSINKLTGEINATEIKNFNTKSRSAQISNMSFLGYDEDNKIIINNNVPDYITPKIKNKLKKIDVIEHYKHNVALRLSDREAIEYFIKHHVSKNVNKIKFDTPDGEKSFFLKSGNNPLKLDEDIENFKKYNLKVELKYRGNMITNTPSKVNQSDFDRFQKHYGKLFKDGIAKRYFRAEDLNSNTYVGKFKDYDNPENNNDDETEKTAQLRLGEFVFKDKNYTFDTEIDFFDMGKVKPILTGTIGYNTPNLNKQLSEKEFSKLSKDKREKSKIWI